MADKQWDLRERLVQFAISIIRLAVKLPNTPEGRLVRGQLIRCGTSPGAQYREACRARSGAEFVSKMESSEQELDETDYWLMIIERTGMLHLSHLVPVQEETRELIRIFAASVKTANTANDRVLIHHSAFIIQHYLCSNFSFVFSAAQSLAWWRCSFASSTWS